jgi:hypothetical protein
VENLLYMMEMRELPRAALAFMKYWQGKRAHKMDDRHLDSTGFT